MFMQVCGGQTTARWPDAAYLEVLFGPQQIDFKTKFSKISIF